MTPVYLDYAATTPIDPRVAAVMRAELESDETFGNPSAVTHVYGRRARARVEMAREQVAALIGADKRDIVFTSGATESNNLAILGIARGNADRGRHIVTSRIEHKAVLDPCRQLEKEGFRVDFLTPDSSGRISAEAVRSALRADTQLVSIMHVNNEIGVVQDIAAIGKLCRSQGVAFHTDAAQGVGKLRIDVRELPVDFLSFTAHKIYGPMGIGALYVRRSARHLLRPITFGGGQEGGLRPGTLATHQIVGFGKACELAAQTVEEEAQRLLSLRERLWQGLEGIGGVRLNGAAAERSPAILNVSVEGVEGESLVTSLTSLALSTGSACNSARGEPSYVLRSLGRSEPEAESSLRLSLGRFTTVDEVDRAIAAIRDQIDRLRCISPAHPAPAGRAPHSARAGTVAGACDSGAAVASAESAAADVAPADDPLSPRARQYFDALPATEPFQATEGRLVQGEAGAQSQGTWIRFHLLVSADYVKDARVQVYGCPHTLAVATWLATQLAGRKRETAIPGTPADWAEAFSVPGEKLGRLLVVEDALRASLQCWAC